MSAGRQVPRLALTPEEAADSIGLGRTSFYEQVLPELPTVRLGRKRLIPVRVLEEWLDREASRIVSGGNSGI